MNNVPPCASSSARCAPAALLPFGPEQFRFHALRRHGGRVQNDERALCRVWNSCAACGDHFLARPQRAVDQNPLFVAATLSIEPAQSFIAAELADQLSFGSGAFPQFFDFALQPCASSARMITRISRSALNGFSM